MYIICIIYNYIRVCVQEGYCKVLPQAERSSYARQLFAAEESAKISRKRIWEDYVEPKDEEDDEEKDEGETENQESKRIINGGTKSTPVERKVDYKKVCTVPDFIKFTYYDGSYTLIR